MTCCGNQRARLLSAGPTKRAVNPGAGNVLAPARPVRHASAYFEYIGRTGITVLGQKTGKRYRFDGPGVRVAVDPADKPALATVPHLRQVMSP